MQAGLHRFFWEKGFSAVEVEYRRRDHPGGGWPGTNEAEGAKQTEVAWGGWFLASTLGTLGGCTRSGDMG